MIIAVVLLVTFVGFTPPAHSEESSRNAGASASIGIALHSPPGNTIDTGLPKTVVGLDGYYKKLSVEAKLMFLPGLPFLPYYSEAALLAGPRFTINEKAQFRPLIGISYYEMNPCYACDLAPNSQRIRRGVGLPMALALDYSVWRYRKITPTLFGNLYRGARHIGLSFTISVGFP
jgi:hypothetical protein